MTFIESKHSKVTHLTHCLYSLHHSKNVHLCQSEVIPLNCNSKLQLTCWSKDVTVIHNYHFYRSLFPVVTVAYLKDSIFSLWCHFSHTKLFSSLRAPFSSPALSSKALKHMPRSYLFQRNLGTWLWLLSWKRIELKYMFQMLCHIGT